MSTPKRKCIYCDTPTRRTRGKGEHILPEAIGGARTLKHCSDRIVCTTCNNEDLSDIDKEFCSKSHLSIVASQEIGTYLSLCWNIDHSADDLLVESKPTWIDGELAALRCYPQITFEKSGAHARGDAEEMRQFGNDEFYRILTRAAKSAFQRYKAGKKAIHPERIEKFMTQGGVRLAPRLFSTDSMKAIATKVDNTSFILRYLTEADRKFAMKSLDRLGEEQPFPNRKFFPGSLTPRISHSFNVGDTIRGLMKIGVNLLAAYCPNTPVNPQTFKAAIEMVLGKYQLDSLIVDQNGFVCADGIQDIAAPNQAHSFRLININNLWKVYSSFFGGRIGALVQFPGPNKESWNTLDLIAPLNSMEWRATERSLYLPLTRARIEWNDTAKFCPSLKIQSVCSTFRTQMVRVKEPKTRKK